MESLSIKILKLISIGADQPLEKASLHTLVRENEVDWGELIVMAIRNKVFPMLAYHITCPEIKQYVPVLIRDNLRTALEANKVKITHFRKAAAEIVKKLEANGIPLAATKGIAFESTIYQGNGSRKLKFDIDFMISPKHRKVVPKLLKELGYQLGNYNSRSKSIQAPSRKKMMIYHLNPDHLPIMSKMIPNPLVKSVAADFANSFTWERSQYSLPIEEALSTIQYQDIPGISDIKLPVMAPSYQFLFTILHLYREAWFDTWFEIGQDVNLNKFTDLIQFWRYHKENLKTGGFTEIVHKHGLEQPVAWVLEHLDRTFQLQTVEELGLQETVSPEYLNTAFKIGGGTRKWIGTMEERLFNPKREAIFVEE